MIFDSSMLFLRFFVRRFLIKVVSVLFIFKYSVIYMMYLVGIYWDKGIGIKAIFLIC